MIPSSFETLDPLERFARLRLIRSTRIGPVNFAHLLARFGTACAAIEGLAQIGGRLGTKVMLADRTNVNTELERAHRIGARMLCLGDTDYPYNLSQIDAAPPVLWALGPLVTHRNAISLVGARNASASGQKMAQILADSLSTLGFHIVSGLARGIDTAAHHASISGGTIAVLGGGVDDIYPEENKGLYESLLCQGLILSESPVGHRAQAKDFPRRNRLIAALSLATVVVEAELRSGSLITARLAIEHNREVFAVPGSPLDPRARGCNELLRRGAYLCENAQDIVSILEPIMGFSEPATGASFVSPPQKIYDDEVALDDEISQLIPKILGLLSHTPSARDDILRLCGGRTVAAMAAISELEMTGFIDVHAGGTLSRIA